MRAAERDDFNKGLKTAAFTAWRMEIAISGLFGGQAKLSYPDYCEKMGLLTEKEIKQNAALKKLQQLHNKQIVKEAEQRANDIMAIDRAARMKAKEQQKGG